MRIDTSITRTVFEYRLPYLRQLQGVTWLALVDSLGCITVPWTIAVLRYHSVHNFLMSLGIDIEDHYGAIRTLVRQVVGCVVSIANTDTQLARTPRINGNAPVVIGGNSILARLKPCSPPSTRK